MDPLLLGAMVGIATIVILFSGVSVAIGLLIVSAGFLLAFDGVRSLELMPELFFGKLDIGQILLQLSVTRNRPDLGTRFECVPDHHVARTLDQAFNEIVMHILVHHDA